jgi:hypothetical protein
VELVRQVLRGVAGQAMRRPVRMSALAVGASGLGAAAGLAFVSGTGIAAHPAVLTPFMVTGPVRMAAIGPWSALTVNGEPVSDAGAPGGPGDEPRVNVTAGERVTFAVTVTVPPHDQVSTFVLGVTPAGAESGIGAPGPYGGIRTVLVTAGQLAPGKHVVTAQWTIPADGAPPAAGYQLDAAAYWPPGTVNEPRAQEAPIASLFVMAGLRAGRDVGGGRYDQRHGV